MPASKLTQDLFVVAARYGHIEESGENAWQVIERCPECSGTQALRIAYTYEGSDRPPVVWSRCVNCFHGFVTNYGVISPAPPPLRLIVGLESDTEAAWREIRSCLGAGAYTAAAHMCRKVLFHVAAEKGMSVKNGKGFAPTFTQCIEYLKNQGYVTAPMEKWVSRIKDLGNEGAHNLAPIDKAQAMLVAEFTLQLLVLIFEVDALMEQAGQGQDVEQP